MKRVLKISILTHVLDTSESTLYSERSVHGKESTCCCAEADFMERGFFLFFFSVQLEPNGF